MNKYARPENFGHPVRNPLLREHFVYRAFNSDDELLYVGCSLHPSIRLKEHRHSNSGWLDKAVRYTLSGPYNYETAREIERQAIYTERSLYNYTPERRQVDVARNMILGRELMRGIKLGVPWQQAFAAAKDVADALVPSVSHRGEFRGYDGQALAAKAAERAHRQAVAA